MTDFKVCASLAKEDKKIYAGIKNILQCKECVYEWENKTGGHVCVCSSLWQDWPSFSVQNTEDGHTGKSWDRIPMWKCSCASFSKRKLPFSPSYRHKKSGPDLYRPPVVQLRRNHAVRSSDDWAVRSKLGLCVSPHSRHFYGCLLNCAVVNMHVMETGNW